MPKDLVRFCFGHANQSVTDGCCKLRNEMASLRKVRTKKESACRFLTQKIRIVSLARHTRGFAQIMPVIRAP
jgi:hypothetical protein